LRELDYRELEQLWPVARNRVSSLLSGVF
jgi:hypothetical protein